MSEQDSILIEQTEHRSVLTLNRPQVSNALSPDMVESLINSLSNIRVTDFCVIKGMGKNFCAGFDLSDLDDLSDGDLLWRFLRIETLLQMIHHAPCPIVVCAQGHAIGAGADIFAASWYRIAAPDARFRMPGWNFGLALGTRRLTKLIGTDATRDMLIDTKSVDGVEAENSGLASESSDPSLWEERLSQLQARSAALPELSRAQMLGLTTYDSRKDDMAAIVETAGRPGLKQRITTYQKRMTKERSARKKETANG